MSSSKPLLLALIASGLVTLTSTSAAGALGVIGPVYQITEPDMLEWIEAKVRAKVESGEALRYQQDQAKRIEQKLLNPDPLRSVTTAIRDRTFFFDPTFTVNENYKDDKGTILVPAGTTINPLDRVALTRPLIFFDGRDPKQVAFAKKFIDSKGGIARPVLVAGSYFTLMERWATPVYFDQKASLIRRFGITAVPAIVQQDGRRLRIDEVAL